MSNLRLVPMNFFDDAALTASPAMLSTLPETFAQLTARDAVARSTSVADQVIQGHFYGESRKIDSFFMFRHNGHGGKVRLQLYQYADYTTQVYDSGAVEIYQLQGFDVEWGTAPLGLTSSDLLGLESPYYSFFTAATCASFKLTFTRCTQPYWEFGRIFLGKYREAPYNPQLGMQFGWKSNTENKRSIGASLRTRGGERWRDLRADMIFATDSDRAIWRDVLGVIDAQDVAISIFPGLGGRPERDHTFNAQLDQHSPFGWTNPSFNENVFTFTEI